MYNPSHHKHAKSKILVAIEGNHTETGLLTAALLKHQGHEVIAFSTKTAHQNCNNLTEEARLFCEQLEIPIKYNDISEQYETKVVDNFIHDKLSLNYTDPCSRCRGELLLNALFTAADESGCSLAASGHYAKIILDPGTHHARIYKAADKNKDQSALFFQVNTELFKKLVLPMGELPFSMVQKLANEFKIQLHDSLDRATCSIRSENVNHFLQERTAPVLRPKGLIKNHDGILVGDHTGLHQYKIGQPIEIALKKDKKELFFVIGFEPKAATLVVGHEKFLESSAVRVDQIKWIQPGARDLIKKQKIEVQVNGQECLADIILHDLCSAHIQFEQPMRSLMNGMPIAFYHQDELLGGGWINQVVLIHTRKI